MAKPKKTPWFDRGTKPTRIGPYETTERLDGSPTFQYWNGERWGSMAFNPAGSLLGAGKHTSRSNPRWRGLAEQPKEQKK